MNLWFTAAGICSLFVCMLHVIGGGKAFARPLLDTDGLSRTVKYTHYYCWHIVTIVLGAMGGMFLWAGYAQSGIDLAIVATLFGVLFMLWSLGIVAISKGKLFEFPQWLLFAPIAMLGIIGVGFG